MNNKNQTMQILLGSKSPRRQQILKEMGYSFSVVHQDIDEIYPEDLPLKDIPLYLAQKKARALRQLITKPDEILLTCDTVVLCEAKCIEKPKDEADAIRMLKSLSGKAHSVISAVSLFGLKAEYNFSDETVVHFEELNDFEIEFYVKNFKPYDKAGSYAIQEWIGINKISKIEGSYYNVMGLPAHLLYKYLEDYKKIENSVNNEMK